MTKHVSYTTVGTCSKAIDFDLIDGKVYNVVFTNGCPGNTRGVASLAEGMDAEEIVKRLKGTPCHGVTSCPDQLATAVEQALKEE